MQVLEGDFLDVSRTMGIATGHIVQGVQFNLFGQRESYWLYNYHPGGVFMLNPRGGILSQPVPAAQVFAERSFVQNAPMARSSVCVDGSATLPLSLRLTRKAPASPPKTAAVMAIAIAPATMTAIATTPRLCRCCRLAGPGGLSGAGEAVTTGDPRAGGCSAGGGLW